VTSSARRKLASCGYPSVIAAAGPDFSVTIDELVKLSIDAGYDRATRRTIHHWRGRGLISAPFQHGRERRYPVQAVGEVDCLARFPPRVYGVDVSTVAVFVEVGILPWTTARDALARLMGRWGDGLETIRDQVEQDPGALRREGAAAAAKRGAGGLPRVVRQPASERARAHTHVLAGGLGVEQDAAQRAAGQRALEEMFGLRAGRGGAAVVLAGLVDDPYETRVDPEQAVALLASVSDVVVEMARALTEFIALWNPVMLASLWGEAPEPFLRLAMTASQQLDPRFYAWLFVQRVVTLAGKDPKTLQQALDGFNTALAARQMYRDLPALRAREARDALRPYAKAQLLLALQLPEEDS
jgi:hypothetical protein